MIIPILMNLDFASGGVVAAATPSSNRVRGFARTRRRPMFYNFLIWLLGM